MIPTKRNSFGAIALICLLTTLSLEPATRGKDSAPAPGTGTALARATVLIIRHAEEPAHGDGLSPVGVAHANAYVNYFEDYSLNGTTPIKLTALFAAADSSASHRPVLTLTR